MRIEPIEDTAEAGEAAAQGKMPWVKPEVTDYEAVAVTQGTSYRIGDGNSNLS